MTVSKQAFTPPSDDPTERSRPWPGLVVVALILAGLLSPLICFAGALIAYAFASREQAHLLAGAGLVHLIVGLTFFGGA